MKKLRTLFLPLLFFLLSTNLRAAFNAQTVRITHNNAFVFIEDARPPLVLKEPLFGFQINRVRKPLTRADAFRTTESGVVDRITTVDLGISSFLSNRFQIGADMPVNMVQVSGRSEQFGLGDARVHLKYRLPYSRIFHIAARGELYAPTGNRALYTTSGTPGAGLGLILEKPFNKYLRMAGNATFRAFAKEQEVNLDYSKTVALSLGAMATIGPKFVARVEGTTQYILSQTEKKGPGDLYVGAGMKIFKGGELDAGVSLGKTTIDKALSLRGILGFKVYPVPEESPRTIVKLKVITKIDCGHRNFNKTFYARKLRSKELHRLNNLPYQSTPDHPISTLQIGEYTGLTGQSSPYVKDSQVVFAVDLHDLPSRKSLVEIHDLTLDMEVIKSSDNPLGHSEILCLLDQKICSGEFFSKADWRKNINQRFFEGKETPNDYFSKQHLVRDAELGSLPLPLHRVIENSPYSDIYSILYENARKDKQIEKKTLYFAVANDMYVSSSTKINLTYTQDTCESEKAAHP